MRVSLKPKNYKEMSSSEIYKYYGISTESKQRKIADAMQNIDDNGGYSALALKKVYDEVVKGEELREEEIREEERGEPSTKITKKKKILSELDDEDLDSFVDKLNELKEILGD